MEHNSPVIHQDKLIIKILLAMAVIFFGIVYEVHRVDIESPQISPIVSKPEEEENSIPGEYIGGEINIKENIDKKIDEIINAQNLSGHQSPSDPETDKKTLNLICSVYKKICLFTFFYGSFSPTEKLTYEAFIIKLLKQLDSSLTTEKLYTQTLHEINLFENGKGRRGYAEGGSKININLSDIKSLKEFKEVLTHELGHVLDIGMLIGTNLNLNVQFTEFNEVKFAIDDPSMNFYAFSWLNENTRPASSSFKDFVSGYGMTDPFEDFAETHNMYIHHNGVFQEMAKRSTILKQKYDFLSNLYGGKYINSDKLNTLRAQGNKEFQPWDSTRM